MERILLVGEAPGKGGIGPALGGRIGRRLAALMGVTVEAYERATLRVNVLPAWPGKAPGNGAAWPRVEARVAARVLAARWHDDGTLDRVACVVLFGRRVAAAFGAGSPDASWFATVPCPLLDSYVFIAPHPSGASRWWNDPENRHDAVRFFSSLYARGVT